MLYQHFKDLLWVMSKAEQKQSSHTQLRTVISSWESALLKQEWQFPALQKSSFLKLYRKLRNQTTHFLKPKINNKPLKSLLVYLIQAKSKQNDNTSRTLYKAKESNCEPQWYRSIKKTYRPFKNFVWLRTSTLCWKTEGLYRSIIR